MKASIRAQKHLWTVVVLGALLPTAAGAEGRPPDSAPEGWHTEATLYLYLPSFGGTTRYPEEPGLDFDVSTSQILDSLQMVFMGMLDVRNGKWGGFTDVMFLDLAASKSNTRSFTIGNGALPADTTADLNLAIKGWSWTLAGEYQVVADPGLRVDLLGGARFFNVRSRLDWAISGSLGPISPSGRTGSSEAGGPVWDGIIGAKGSLNLDAGRKWSIPFYVDAGTGGSVYTWQAAAGVSYAFKWGSLSAMWRYLDYKFEAPTDIETFNLNGPLVAATFRW